MAKVRTSAGLGFVDGAFYWVGGSGRWKVAQFSGERDRWWLPGIDTPVPTLAIPEIGPCLGKEPAAGTTPPSSADGEDE